jgi:uncharacterized damage-inducible protein DinB
MISGLSAAATLFGQSSPAAPPAAAAANPVVWSAQQLYARESKNMLAAAEEMPEGKYSYHPTADQWTFAKLISHVAQSNGSLCSALSDTPAPATVKVADTASKAELTAALKASFDFCGPVLDNLHDAKLGDTVTLFRGARMPRAAALMTLNVDLADHYSQLAGYLRLNGMLPPSAQPKK